MGDERSAAAEPAASAAATAAAPAGGDQVSVRPSSSPPAIGGASVKGSETREGEFSPLDVAGLGAGTPTDSAEARRGRQTDGGEGEFGDGVGEDAEDVTDAGEAEDAGEAAKRQLKLDDIEVHVVRAIRYHEARARFLDFWRRTFDFLVILGGAGSVTAAANTYPLVATMLGLALAAIGAFQLVAGFSEKAGQHAALKREFCDILARIAEVRTEGDLSRRTIAKLTKRWSAIWADEPPTMHVLESIAYNAAIRTLRSDLGDDELIAINGWQSLTRNLSSWESFEPLTRAEKRAAAEKRRAVAQRQPG